MAGPVYPALRPARLDGTWPGPRELDCQAAIWCAEAEIRRMTIRAQCPAQSSRGRRRARASAEAATALQRRRIAAMATARAKRREICSGNVGSARADTSRSLSRACLLYT